MNDTDASAVAGTAFSRRRTGEGVYILFFTVGTALPFVLLAVVTCGADVTSPSLTDWTIDK